VFHKELHFYGHSWRGPGSESGDTLGGWHRQTCL